MEVNNIDGIEINECTKDNTDKTNLKHIKKNLVLCGGGIKGIIHSGVLFALEELGLLKNFKEFAGSSVGGLILTLYILGYSPAELYDFVKLFDLRRLKNISIMNIDLFGLDIGYNMEYVTKRLIKGKGFDENITLKELYDKTNKKLILVTVCLNTLELCYVSYETFPDLPVFIAVRMTTSIPFIYCPVQYKNKMYIDGGCLDNYPMSLFKDQLDETLGILLIDTKHTIENIDNLEVYILRVLQCMMTGMFINSQKGYDDSTIGIHVESIDFTDYGISDAKKDAFFIKGYKAVMDNINKLK